MFNVGNFRLNSRFVSFLFITLNNFYCFKSLRNSLCKYNIIQRHKFRSKINLRKETNENQINADFYEINVYEPHINTEEVALKHFKDLNKWMNNHILHEHTIAAFEEAKAFVDRFYGSSYTG